MVAMIVGPSITNADVHARIAQAVTFTHVYRQQESAHPALREAQCLRAQFPALLQPIGTQELFAGRSIAGLVGRNLECRRR